MNVRDRCARLLSLLRVAVELDVGGVRSAAAAVARTSGRGGKRLREAKVPTRYPYASRQETGARPLALTPVCHERRVDGTVWTYRVVPASLDTGRSFAFFLAAVPADGASEPLGLEDDGDARWRRVAAAYGPDGARALARILRAIAAASTPRVSHDDDDSYDDERRRQ